MKAVTNFQEKEKEYQEKVSNAGFIDAEEREVAQRRLKKDAKNLIKLRKKLITEEKMLVIVKF